jgi:hypothetical protein
MALSARIAETMRDMLKRSLLPAHLWVLIAVYFVASLAHFAHNAEFIAFYPNMPSWLTREQVYLAWLAVMRLACFLSAHMVPSGSAASPTTPWRSAPSTRLRPTRPYGLKLPAAAC